MDFIIYLLIVTILFIIYTEYSVGNIVYRIDSSGLKHLHLSNIIYYLFNPLHNLFLWNIKLLDVNYIFVITLFTIIYKNILS